MGFAASQIIFDKLLSIGDMVIAIKYIARNARPNIRSIPAETIIASRMTGISPSTKTVTSHVAFE